MEQVGEREALAEDWARAPQEPVGWWEESRPATRAPGELARVLAAQVEDSVLVQELALREPEHLVSEALELVLRVVDSELELRVQLPERVQRLPATLPE